MFQRAIIKIIQLAWLTQEHQNKKHTYTSCWSFKLGWNALFPIYMDTSSWRSGFPFRDTDHSFIQLMWFPDLCYDYPHQIHCYFLDSLIHAMATNYHICINRDMGTSYLNFSITHSYLLSYYYISFRLYYLINQNSIWILLYFYNLSPTRTQILSI